jgi:hypothetical protein
MGSDNKKWVDRSRRSKDRISRSHKEEKEKGGSSVSSGEYPPSTSGSRYKSHSGAGGGGEDGSVSSHSSALLISKYKSRPIKPKKESDSKSGSKSGSSGWFKFAMILIFMMALWVGVYFGKIDTVAAVKAVTGSKESTSEVTEKKVEVEKEANESDRLNEKVSEEEADDPDAALAALASGSGNSLWESTLKKNDASDRGEGTVGKKLLTLTSLSFSSLLIHANYKESSKETSKSNAEEGGESEGTESKMYKQKKGNKLEGTEEAITTDDKEEGEVVQAKESDSSFKRSGKSEIKQGEDQEESESGGKEDRYRSEERDEEDPMPKTRSRTSTAQEDEVNSRTIITSKDRDNNADEDATVGTKNLRGSLVSKEVDKADSREFEVTSNDEESGVANEKVRTRINDIDDGDAQVVDISREETREQVRDESSSITIRTEDETDGSDQETVTASNGKQRVVTLAGDAEEDEGQKDKKSRSINKRKEMSKQEKSVNEKIVLSDQNQSDEGENINVDQSPDDEMRQSKGKIQNQQGEEIEAQGNEESTSQEENQKDVESTRGEEIQGEGSRRQGEGSRRQGEHVYVVSSCIFLITVPTIEIPDSTVFCLKQRNP